MSASRKHRDEIWGHVLEVLPDGELIVQVTDVETQNEHDYAEEERIFAERGGAEPGDSIHMWIRERDAGGTLFGRVVREDEDGEPEEEEEEDDDDEPI